MTWSILQKFTLVISLSILMLSCTDELVRIDLSKNQTAEIKLQCEKNQTVEFYLDFDLEYYSKPLMVLEFEFFRGDKMLFNGGVDPLVLNPVEMSFKEELDQGKKQWKSYGKLQGDFNPPADTTFTIRPILVMNQTPGLKINKFELVLVR